MKELSKILVPVDGSAGADKALELAVQLAEATGASLDILHVAYFASETDSCEISWLPDNVAGSVKAEAELALTRAKDYLAARVKANYYQRSGIPATEIVSFADENQDGLIVVGGRGLGAVEGFLLGSVRQEVIERSLVPTLVAK